MRRKRNRKIRRQKLGGGAITIEERTREGKRGEEKEADQEYMSRKKEGSQGGTQRKEGTKPSKEGTKPSKEGTKPSKEGTKPRNEGNGGR